MNKKYKESFEDTSFRGEDFNNFHLYLQSIGLNEKQITLICIYNLANVIALGSMSGEEILEYLAGAYCNILEKIEKGEITIINEDNISTNN